MSKEIQASIERAALLEVLGQSSGQSNGNNNSKLDLGKLNLSDNVKSKISARLGNNRNTANGLTEEFIAKHRSEISNLAQVINENWSHIFEVKKQVQAEVKDLQKIISKIKKEAKSEGRKLSLEENFVINEIKNEVERLQENFLQKSGQDRDFYFAVRGEQLREYGKQLEKGKIVEVPYVSEKMETILGYLKRGKNVFITGDTGGGKTEVAKVAAKNFSGGREPVVIRCYPQMGQEELFGHLSLTAKGFSKVENIMDDISKAITKWETKNPNSSKELTDKAAELITKKLLNSSGVTVMEYLLGSFYIGMKEGRVVIFDEGNALKPELRRKLNDLYTYKAGQNLTIQEDGGQKIKIKKGYGVIITANEGERYGEGKNGRYEYDPAELDRFGRIEYDYLPQATEGALADIIDPKQKQLFSIAVANLIDSKGNLTAPAGSLEKLWDLAQFGALTQHAFRGTLDSAHFINNEGVGFNERIDVLITPRKLHDILSHWQEDNFRYELDYYVGLHLVEQAKKPIHKAILYHLGQLKGFFKSDNWQELPSDLQRQKSFQLNLTQNRAEGLELHDLSQVVEAIWGKAPERSVWEPGKKEEAVSETVRIAIIRDLKQLIESLNEEIENQDASNQELNSN
jgi:MoxR-like ATPase